MKELRKLKKLWLGCKHRFVPHYEFDPKADGFWEVGERCKLCGYILRRIE